MGVATDLLREEFGAAVFKAQATILLDRLRYCMPGHEAAEVRRHTQRKQWLSREAHASCRGRAMARFRYPGRLFCSYLGHKRPHKTGWCAHKRAVAGELY